MFLSDILNISSEREYTSEGFLKVPARISRTGVQDYLASELGVTDKEPDAKISVYRPEEEVFNDESLKSFASKPVTNNHPPELINSENFKDFSVGFSGETVQRDGMFSKTTLNITDADAIKNIQSGKVELSNGYTADIDWTPGVTDGGISYDAIQRNIKGNHIALVERGRAGADCRLADNLTTIGDNMAKVTIEGIDFEVPEQAAQAINKLVSKLKEAEAKTTDAEEEMKKKEDEAEQAETESKKKEDELEAKLDDALSKIPTATHLDTLVEQRTALIDSARRVAPALEWTGKDAATICKEVVAEKCPTVKIDDVSSDYIKARFDMLVDAVSETSELDSALSTQVTKKTSVEDSRPADVIAREKMIADSKTAWKTRGVK